MPIKIYQKRDETRPKIASRQPMRQLRRRTPRATRADVTADANNPQRLFINARGSARCCRRYERSRAC